MGGIKRAPNEEIKNTKKKTSMGRNMYLLRLKLISAIG